MPSSHIEAPRAPFAHADERAAAQASPAAARFTLLDPAPVAVGLGFALTALLALALRALG